MITPQYILLATLFYPTFLHASGSVLSVEQPSQDASTTISSSSESLPSDLESMPFGFPASSSGSGASASRHGGQHPAPFAYRHPQVPLDVESYAVAPKPLQLEQVHVYVRHGERTPVGVRLANAPANIPQHWDMCRTARSFRPAMSSIFQAQDRPDIQEYDDIIQTRKIVEREDGTAVEGECLLGELTDLGRQSTFDYGKNLRRLYVERLGFLPDVLDKEETAYFRTTNMPRTTETLQEIIHGLYPTGKRLFSVPRIRVRNGKDENLVGNTYSCKRLQVLLVGFAKAAADKHNPTLASLDNKLSRYINGNPIRVDGHPRASGIFDTVRSAVAHGIKVPSEFEDPSIIDVIEHAITTEWFSDKTEEVRRLGMGRLLEDLTNKIHHKVERDEKDPLKILVHATHDTAIAAIRQTLDVYDEKWPAFTASITFELFKAEGTRDDSVVGQSQALLSRFRGKSTAQHYVRMRSQNENLALPFCAGEGKHLPGHPEFCTLEAFTSRMKQLIPKDWDGECSVNTTAKVSK